MDEARPNTALYYPLFAIIAVLFLVTIGVSFTNLDGHVRLIINLAITVVQVALLSLFFMHLRQSDRLTWIVALTGLFFVGIMFTLTLGDYLFRKLGGL